MTKLTIKCGDFTEVDLPENKVDLFILDLPYNLTAKKWDKDKIDLARLWQIIHRMGKGEWVAVFFAIEPFTTSIMNSNLPQFRADLIWLKNKKTGHLNVRRKPMRRHEKMLVFSEQFEDMVVFAQNKTYQYDPQMTDGHKPTNFSRRKPDLNGIYNVAKEGITPKGRTTRYPTTVWEFPVVNNDDPDRIHSSQKPIPLLVELIRTYGVKGGVVCDLTMGSGSTGRAAMMEGCSEFIGVEKMPEMFKKAETWLKSPIQPSLMPVIPQ